MPKFHTLVAVATIALRTLPAAYALDTLPCDVIGPTVGTTLVGGYYI